MVKRLSTVAVLLMLLLCIAIGWFWFQSYRAGDGERRRLFLDLAKIMNQERAKALSFVSGF
jgi:hypothetical protein